MSNRWEALSNKLSHTNYASSAESFFEYFSEMQQEAVDDFRTSKSKPAFYRAQVLNGLVDKNMRGTSLDPSGAKRYKNARLFNFRILEHGPDGRKRPSPTSHLPHPTEFAGAEERAACILNHPVARPEDFSDSTHDIAPGDIIRVYWRNDRWWYTTNGPSSETKDYAHLLYRLLGHGLSPQNAFANVGSVPKGLPTYEKDKKNKTASLRNNKDRKIGDIEYIIMHYSVSWNLDETRGHLMKGRNGKPLAYHYLIDFDGNKHYFHPEAKAAPHSLGYAPKSIGINIVGMGPAPFKKDGRKLRKKSDASIVQEKMRKKFNQLGVWGHFNSDDKAGHRNEDGVWVTDRPGQLHQQFGDPTGTVKYWLPYTPKQIQAAKQLVTEVMSRWEINPLNIFMHSMASTSGKQDAGPALFHRELVEYVSANYTGPPSADLTREPSGLTHGSAFHLLYQDQYGYESVFDFQRRKTEWEQRKATKKKLAKAATKKKKSNPGDGSF